MKHSLKRNVALLVFSCVFSLGLHAQGWPKSPSCAIKKPLELDVATLKAYLDENHTPHPCSLANTMLTAEPIVNYFWEHGYALTEDMYGIVLAEIVARRRRADGNDTRHVTGPDSYTNHMLEIWHNPWNREPSAPFITDEALRAEFAIFQQYFPRVIARCPYILNWSEQRAIGQVIAFLSLYNCRATHEHIPFIRAFLNEHREEYLQNFGGAPEVHEQNIVVIEIEPRAPQHVDTGIHEYRSLEDDIDDILRRKNEYKLGNDVKRASLLIIEELKKRGHKAGVEHLFSDTSRSRTLLFASRLSIRKSLK